MKVYRVAEDIALVGEVPDGAEYIEIGARPHDRDEPPITYIDRGAQLFRRGDGELQPFPPVWYSASTEIDWKLYRVGTRLYEVT